MIYLVLLMYTCVIFQSGMGNMNEIDLNVVGRYCCIGLKSLAC